jgi:phosphohistidine phosphatase
MGERQWVLLRHANAEARSASGKDSDRALSPHGQLEARAAAQWLQAQAKGRALRILSSPATRAAATAAILAEVTGAEIQLEPEIYEATPGTLISLLNDAGATGITVLVGHNPGLEQTVALLGEGRTDEYRGMPTGAIAWFEVPAGLVEPGSGRLAAFWLP